MAIIPGDTYADRTAAGTLGGRNSSGTNWDTVYGGVKGDSVDATHIKSGGLTAADAAADLATQAELDAVAAAKANTVHSHAGLRVSNSAAATMTGVLSKKMEVFDAAGTSLGFVPVYTTIT